MKKFGLSKSERIKSEKDFKKIYTSGKILLSGDQKFKAHYYIERGNSQPAVKIAPAVSRKAGKAVWRNRIKRLVRESYRLNKEILTEVCKEKNSSLMIIFSPYSVNEKKLRHPVLPDVMPAVTSLMNKVRSAI